MMATRGDSPAVSPPTNIACAEHGIPHVVCGEDGDKDDRDDDE